MTPITNGYDQLLFQKPEPPADTLELLTRAWDAFRGETWLLEGAWPDDRGAPGAHLTEAGTDDHDGRWIILHGERFTARDAALLRHETKSGTIHRIWWRTHWQSWPPMPGQTREPTELRLELDSDPEHPVKRFQLYVPLGTNQKPAGSPELRTFDDDADTEMPTDAATVIETNPTVADLLEWIAWLPFDDASNRDASDRHP